MASKLSANQQRVLDRMKEEPKRWFTAYEVSATKSTMLSLSIAKHIEADDNLRTFRVKCGDEV